MSVAAVEIEISVQAYEQQTKDGKVSLYTSPSMKLNHVLI
jgi:hypothetical protein